MKSDPQPERNPANYSLLPADRYQFKGSLVVKRHLKEGLGAPLVAVSKDRFQSQWRSILMPRESTSTTV